LEETVNWPGVTLISSSESVFSATSCTLRLFSLDVAHGSAASGRRLSHDDRDKSAAAARSSASVRALVDSSESTLAAVKSSLPHDDADRDGGHPALWWLTVVLIGLGGSIRRQVTRGGGLGT
jgi:hypothetical protein